MKRSRRPFALLFALLLLPVGAAGAAPRPAASVDVRYTVAMPEPATHLYTVTMRVANLAVGRKHVDLKFPVWTPGSYLVREFERNVQDFAATSGGRAARWEKTDKSTWRVWLAPNARDLEATYRVYANELTVRTSHLDDSHAYFNGANLFFYVDGAKDVPVRLTLVVPSEWKVATGLERAEGPTPSGATSAYTFTAPDYDRLVDSPVEAGPNQILTFEALGKPHEIAIWGHGNEDPERMTADVKKIVETAGAIFGNTLPYDRYVFILHLSANSGGGLEHLNSTTLGTRPFVFQKKEFYKNFLGLVAHEYFHAWLVKRIRPEALGPFDYTTENYTKMLWLMEGGTDFFAMRVLERAGLLTEDEFYKELAKQIQDLENTPGRRRMSVEDASFNAWIKGYRPNEHSVNDQISYYTKGAVVSAMLDFEIRGRTNGAKSLDDVLRYLWANYTTKGKGIPENALQPAVEAVAGGSFEEFFDKYVRGTAEIDYNRFLAKVGYKLIAETPKDESRIDPSKSSGWLGANTRESSTGLSVTEVLEESPAWKAGLNAGDELVAIDGLRATQSSLNDRIADRAPGETVTLTVFRRDLLRTIPVTLGERPPQSYKIVKIEEKK